MSDITRNEFLKKLGFGGGSLMAIYCLGFSTTSCAVETGAGSDEDFLIDLSKKSFKPLSSIGGWVKVRNVVLARTGADSFAAVSAICSHEGEKKIEFRPSEKDFRCAAHGAEFDLNGIGKNKKGRKGLQIFQTAIEGNFLRITLKKDSKS